MRCAFSSPTERGVGSLPRSSHPQRDPESTLRTIADRLLCQLHADMALTSETKCSHGLPVRLVAIETIGGKL